MISFLQEFVGMRSSDSLSIVMTHKTDISLKKSYQLFDGNFTKFIFICMHIRHQLVMDDSYYLIYFSF